jgi:hypothetical protein
VLEQPNVRLCECGCGEPAPIATKTSTAQGYVRGEPMRFVHGHATRNQSEATRRKIGDTHRGMTRSRLTRRNLRAAKLAQSADTRRKISIAKGGTGNTTVKSIRQRLIRRHPKAGICEECGSKGRTDYAFIRHPEPHTEDINDYLELCRTCHVLFDRWGR